MLNIKIIMKKQLGVFLWVYDITATSGNERYFGLMKFLKNSVVIKKIY